MMNSRFDNLGTLSDVRNEFITTFIWLKPRSHGAVDTTIVDTAVTNCYVHCSAGHAHMRALPCSHFLAVSL